MKPYLERKQSEYQEDLSKALNPESKPETLTKLYEKYKQQSRYTLDCLFSNPSFPADTLSKFINEDSHFYDSDKLRKRWLYAEILQHQANKITKEEYNKVNAYWQFISIYTHIDLDLDKYLQKAKGKK